MSSVIRFSGRSFLLHRYLPVFIKSAAGPLAGYHAGADRVFRQAGLAEQLTVSRSFDRFKDIATGAAGRVTGIRDPDIKPLPGIEVLVFPADLQAAARNGG